MTPDQVARTARAGQHAVALVTHATTLADVKTPHDSLLHAVATARMIEEATRDVGAQVLIGSLIGLTSSLVRLGGDDAVAQLHVAARKIAGLAASTDVT